MKKVWRKYREDMKKNMEKIQRRYREDTKKV